MRRTVHESVGPLQPDETAWETAVARHAVTFFTNILEFLWSDRTWIVVRVLRADIKTTTLSEAAANSPCMDELI